ncbi:Nucleoside phosphorylase domain [Dillenia turbinata]|uniref:Nucleoside phosphorylase domain n=1 Tax=Dillenia turbinata TaxID=194707 RepID=A0AAN8V737_9MAGN
MIGGSMERRLQSWSWGAEFEVMVVGVMLMVLVQQSLPLRSSHPLHDVVDRINQNAGPYIGLVMAYSTEEDALHLSGLFIPSSDTSSVDLAGRRFNIGTIKGVDVIYVMTGEQTVNAGITVQMLINIFDIWGIVHYGTAGATSDSLLIGDVTVPEYFAYTASWKWTEFKSERQGLPELNVGAYNYPTKGENLLASIEFTPVELYSNGEQMEEIFWLPTNPTWFGIASQVQDLQLQQCLNDTYCLPNTPKVVHGVRGSTADIYLDNEAYRDFLFHEFNVSTHDEESAAIVMACRSNGIPCIVFRGISDLAGGGKKLSLPSLSSLAAANAVTVAIKFIELIGNGNSTYSRQDQ